MEKSIALEKAISFALRVVRLHKFLTEEKKEFILSKQLLLSGTFVAKHVKAATVAENRSAFAAEMFKGMQTASDSELWLFLLYEGGWLEENQYESINTDCVEMIKLTSSIAKTSRESD